MLSSSGLIVCPASCNTRIRLGACFALSDVKNVYLSKQLSLTRVKSCCECLRSARGVLTPSCSTNAMDIVFRLIGKLSQENLFIRRSAKETTHIDVDDELNILDIQTASSDIRGNENHLSTTSKFTNGKISLWLLFIAVNAKLDETSMTVTSVWSDLPRGSRSVWSNDRSRRPDVSSDRRPMFSHRVGRWSDGVFARTELVSVLPCKLQWSDRYLDWLPGWHCRWWHECDWEREIDWPVGALLSATWHWTWTFDGRTR